MELAAACCHVLLISFRSCYSGAAVAHEASAGLADSRQQVKGPLAERPRVGGRARLRNRLARVAGSSALGCTTEARFSCLASLTAGEERRPGVGTDGRCGQ